MSVLHMDGEASVICSDSFPDHQHALALLGLIQTQTLPQRTYKLLFWLRKLTRRTPVNLPVLPNQSGLHGDFWHANLGLLLLLEHRNNLLGRLFGDILIIPQPGDFGIRRAGDVGVDLNLLSLLDAQT